jgi:hypothetical protein
LEGCSAFLEGGRDRPAVCLALHKPFGLQMEGCGQEVRVAMRARAVMNLHPASSHPVPNAVPVPRAGDAFDVSGGTSLPGPWEVETLGHLRYPLLGRSQLLALHPRPADCAARAWRWRFVQGRIPIKLAHQGEMTAVLTADSRGLAGAVARVSHKHAGPLRQPAHQARQQQSG